MPTASLPAIPTTTKDPARCCWTGVNRTSPAVSLPSSVSSPLSPCQPLQDSVWPLSPCQRRYLPVSWWDTVLGLTATSLSRCPPPPMPTTARHHRPPPPPPGTSS